LTSQTPGGRQPETAVASVSDRLSFPLSRPRSGRRRLRSTWGVREGSDLRETADTNDGGRGLGGIKTHGRNVHPSPATGSGAWTRRRSNALKSTGPACVATRAPGGPPWIRPRPGHAASVAGREENNGKRATAAVTRCGCRRGANLRRVIAARIRSGSPLRGGARPDARRGCLVHPSSGARETQRTPCPVPGCNKPGPCGAEKPAEVVRNHEGGTRCCGVAATARWSAFGRSWSGPLQVPEKGTREGSSPRKEGPCGARRSLAGDERQVVPFQSGALNAT
jgi:hypothetical protein